MLLWSKLATALALLPCILAKPIAVRQHWDSEVAGVSKLQRRAAGGATYAVASGDSGSSIAAMYSITFSALSSANPNVDLNKLQSSQRLNMPSSRTPYIYVASSSDSQPIVATRFNVYADDLANANPSVVWNNLSKGTKLRIPTYGVSMTYTVTNGDYGNAIASAFGISFSSLSTANPVVNWTNLQIGQALTIPMGTSPTKGTLPSSAVPSASSTTASTTTSKSTTSVTTTTTLIKITKATTTSTTSSTQPATTTSISKSSSTSSSSTASTTKSVTTVSSSSTISTSSKPSSTTTSSSSSFTTTSKITTTTSTSKTTTTTTTTAAGTGEPSVTPTATVSGANYVKGGNNNDGVSSRSDAYTFYKGDGSTTAGWPAKSQWISFSTMWNNLSPYLGQSCQSIYGVANNSPQENQYIYNAIQAVSTNSGVDHRLILANIIQESSGCVRVKTTISADGTVTNPGLMQDFNGSGSCNKNGVILNPCPASQIYQMIQDGTFGTSTDGGKTYSAGLVQDINSSPGYSDAQVIYRAARIYNSGSVPSSNNLGDPGATRCYASDMANRLMGWVGAKRTCTLDG